MAALIKEVDVEDFINIYGSGFWTVLFEETELHSNMEGIWIYIYIYYL